VRKSRAEVPHEETRKEFFKRQYNKALTILKPVEVMFDGLAVEGEGFETRFLMEKEAELQRLAQEEEQRRLEEEKLRRKQANRGKSSLTTN
jgi:hypothetical protein